MRAFLNGSWTDLGSTRLTVMALEPVPPGKKVILTQEQYAQLLKNHGAKEDRDGDVDE